jgi:hypothetical protein
MEALLRRRHKLRAGERGREVRMQRARVYIFFTETDKERARKKQKQNYIGFRSKTRNLHCNKRKNQEEASRTGKLSARLTQQ